MPKYSYGCRNCLNTWDKWHSMSETEKECPQCHAQVIHKIPTMFSVVESQKEQPGKVVSEHINEAKQDVEQYKKELKEMKI